MNNPLKAITITEQYNYTITTIIKQNQIINKATLQIILLMQFK